VKVAIVGRLQKKATQFRSDRKSVALLYVSKCQSLSSVQFSRKIPETVLKGLKTKKIKSTAALIFKQLKAKQQYSQRTL